MHDCMGYLTKRGSSIKTWHRRYFELQGVNLLYFTAENGVQKGEYVINSDTAVEDAHLRRNCFCLVQHGRTLFMAADTLPEKEMWMNALDNAIERARFLEKNKRLSFKKRELSNRSLEEENALQTNLDRISEITEDTAIMSLASPAKKKIHDFSMIPKSKNPVFSNFESKLVHFHIMNARNLYSKGTSDTFARITVGNETKQTNVIKRDLNPTWDETFSFEWNYTMRYARIEVWDVGTFGMGERFLGVVFLPIIPISSMSQIGKWYKLGKRSTKSRVSGDIYIDAYCDECYDFYPLQILNTVQDMDDLRGHVSNPVSVIPEECGISESQAVQRIAGKFMMQFPPIETEHLEDLCVSVTMKPAHGKSRGCNNVFCDGILLLTNYRLIFVSNSRLMFNDKDFYELDTDLTTFIPLATITNVASCSDADPHDTGAKVYHDGVIVETNDARVYTFLFYEDVELNNEGNILTNRKASTDGNKLNIFATNGEEKSGATFSGVSNDFRYLDSNESIEGPPSKRFLAAIERKNFNRLCELHASINIHHPLTTTLLYDPKVDSDKDDNIDDPELNGDMLQWLKSLPATLRRSYRAVFLDGWSVYNPEEEFGRMKIPDGNWRITYANNTFELCSTYPAVLAVPALISDAKLALASLFRSRGRLPVLSWRHPNNFCSITRSSQPLVGMQKRQSPEDEMLLGAINQAAMGPAHLHHQPRKNFRGEISSPFVVFDARPKLNAAANQAAGKGYEMDFAYKNTNVVFLNIDNIHVMRKSYDALEECCRSITNEDPGWYGSLENSGWLVHCSRVLMGAVRLVHCMCKEQLSVLVHCSDGWDRTSQVTSLSMLMMDPYYRTYTGFQVLIEKEWCSFGHKFGERLGWTESGWGSQDRSPVFLQFLDCVHQMLHQNPDIFEFNEELLLFILQQAHTGWFGNFIANCEKDKVKQRLELKTVSIWSYVQLNFCVFGNPNYKPSASDVWVPVATIRKMVLWDKWFLRWHDSVWQAEWKRRNEDFSELEDVSSSRELAVHGSVNCCYDCETKFTFFVRRNHCFNCKNVFCENCLVAKEDIQGREHLYCKNCFEVYDEQIHSELKGISDGVLQSAGMTRRVLGSASDITLQRKRDSVENHPVVPSTRDNNTDVKELTIDNSDDEANTNERDTYDVEFGDDDDERIAIIDSRNHQTTPQIQTVPPSGQSPTSSKDKKSTLLGSLSSKIKSNSVKNVSREEEWKSATNTPPRQSTATNKSTKPSSAPPDPPTKRFIPFSNAMMTTSTSDLMAEQKAQSGAAPPRSNDSPPLPLARKHSSRKQLSPSRSDSMDGSRPRRMSSKSSLLRGDAPLPPPSDQQISILPKEDERTLNRKNSDTSRFEVYKNTSINLSKPRKSFDERRNSNA